MSNRSPGYESASCRTEASISVLVPVAHREVAGPVHTFAGRWSMTVSEPRTLLSAGPAVTGNSAWLHRTITPPVGVCQSGGNQFWVVHDDRERPVEQGPVNGSLLTNREGK
jgi:hypothetical protein